MGQTEQTATGMPDLENFKKFCFETGRLKWAEYVNIPVMLEYAGWFASQPTPAVSPDVLARIEGMIASMRKQVANPLRSWEAGECVDARIVEDYADELAALRDELKKEPR